MYDTTIAAKLLKQLESFLGRISPHFHKPVARFIGDMVYGIMVEKDVKLSSIVRALKEKITPKKVEDRLSRMLSSDGLEAGLHGVIASEGAKRVHKDTLIILDPSDVQKPYARWTKSQQTFLHASLNRALNPASTPYLNVLHAMRRLTATLRQLPSAMNSSASRRSSGDSMPSAMRTFSRSFSRTPCRMRRRRMSRARLRYACASRCGSALRTCHGRSARRLRRLSFWTAFSALESAFSLSLL